MVTVHLHMLPAGNVIFMHVADEAAPAQLYSACHLSGGGSSDSVCSMSSTDDRHANMAENRN